MSSRQVKEYLSQHYISRLLEDPLRFLQDALKRTRTLGGPEAVSWDTFIHHLSPLTSKTPPDPQIIPHTGTLLPLIATQIPPVPPRTPPPAHPGPPAAPSGPPAISMISKAPISAPPEPAGAPLVHTEVMQPDRKAWSEDGPPGPCSSPVLPPGPGSSPVLSPGPPGPGPSPVLPPVPGSSPDLPPGPPGPPGPGSSPVLPPGPGSSPVLPPGPGSSVVHSQLSIESDSDMTESSGLLQEISILPLQRPRPLIIFIIGGPGSGKGSQTTKLTAHFSFRGLSLDELLRRQLLTDATPGRRWELMSELMSHGELGTQEDTVSELRQQLIGQQEVGGVIVDGFPRDVHQALSFQEQVGSPDLVLLLVCSNETLRGRLRRRAARLGLLGDGDQTLQRRLDRFQRDIVSISRYYRQLHLLTQVDADRDLELVFADLSSAVRQKLSVKNRAESCTAESA
ncbi:adenylate kinase isoenzyme 5-like isoform X2 [Acanthochromis polyacanthus]|uniref:adenylate kinase isoenzyme 5-like isoform X2 n=1 Tax=Acanthochromis polyacanthus TaxID=80966 RepID=UPI0022347508|nr:adenylate kinase isoenzyme 5-like isoform X2 [Acanthochromis polyacanthus]